MLCEMLGTSMKQTRIRVVAGLAEDMDATTLVTVSISAGEKPTRFSRLSLAY